MKPNELQERYARLTGRNWHDNATAPDIVYASHAYQLWLESQVAPPPQAGAEDAETFLKTLPESSVNFGGDLHAAVVDAMEKYARHIAAKAVEDEVAKEVFNDGILLGASNERQRVTRLVDEEATEQNEQLKHYRDHGEKEAAFGAAEAIIVLAKVKSWLNPQIETT